MVVQSEGQRQIAEVGRGGKEEICGFINHLHRHSHAGYLGGNTRDIVLRCRSSGASRCCGKFRGIIRSAVRLVVYIGITIQTENVFGVRLETGNRQLVFSRMAYDRPRGIVVLAHFYAVLRSTLAGRPVQLNAVVRNSPLRYCFDRTRRDLILGGDHTIEITYAGDRYSTHAYAAVV